MHVHTEATLPPSRCAVLTGAAGGLGASIARELVAQGATVHALDRDEEGLERLSRELGRERFVAHAVDLTDRRAADLAAARILGRTEGRCDTLVNNAGIASVRALGDTEDALLDRLLAVNFIAAFRLTRALLPALLASGRGSIVNIASELALVGARDYSAYCATKGAILAWSRALAVELAGQGVRVNAVCPGPVDTPMLQAEFATHGVPERARAAEIAAVPLGRLGRPGDIAPVVAFLSSDAAAFVTGAAWPVDGGKTAQ